MLFIISTPIGNLGDITFRAIETLKSCNLVLCEDTRHSLKLLNHYEIKVPLLSYHKFNEREREEKIIAELRSGKKVGLISDGGTPLISDPGARIVQRLREEGLEVTVLPGACALVASLTLAGLGDRPFQFLGFSDEKLCALCYNGLSIYYEPPHQIVKTLKALPGETKVYIAREITKIHEELLEGTAEELLTHFEAKPPRGEMVLMIEGQLPKDLFEECSVEETVKRLQKSFGITLKEAIKLAASLKGVPKRDVYDIAHNIKR